MEGNGAKRATIGRLTSHDGALLVIDLQERLLGVMSDRSLVVDNTIRLIHGATLLHLPVIATEQYPKGLGPTIPEIAALVPHRPSKTLFHCCEAVGLMDPLGGDPIKHVTLAGIEAHVCVAQTAVELLRLGYTVQIAADAVTSRKSIDRDFALRRLEHAGAVVSTTEAILFEWTERSDRPEFKAISRLVKLSDTRQPEGLTS